MLNSEPILGPKDYIEGRDFYNLESSHFENAYVVDKLDKLEHCSSRAEYFSYKLLCSTLNPSLGPRSCLGFTI